MRIPDRETQNDIILATLGRFMMGEWGQMAENIGCLVRTGTVVSDPGVRIGMQYLMKDDVYKQRLQAVVDAEKAAEESEWQPETEENAGEFPVMGLYPEYAAAHVGLEERSRELLDFRHLLDRDVHSALSENRSLDRDDPLFRAYLIGGLTDQCNTYDLNLEEPKNPFDTDPFDKGPGAAA